MIRSVSNVAYSLKKFEFHFTCPYRLLADLCPSGRRWPRPRRPALRWTPTTRRGPRSSCNQRRRGTPEPPSTATGGQLQQQQRRRAGRVQRADRLQRRAAPGRRVALRDQDQANRPRGEGGHQGVLARERDPVP